MSRIVIEVDEQVAKAYMNANPEKKVELSDAINALLKKAINHASTQDYRKMLDSMSDEAEENGLTDEILKDLLKVHD